MGPSSLVFFCPVCWTETPTGGGTCPRCGADMEAVQQSRDFVDKLIAALDHPEPETRARAGERFLQDVSPLVRGRAERALRLPARRSS